VTELVEMDEAANQAEEEIKQIPKENLKIVADWWRKWYGTAGHKRLGRLLLKYAK